LLSLSFARGVFGLTRPASRAPAITCVCASCPRTERIPLSHDYGEAAGRTPFSKPLNVAKGSGLASRSSNSTCCSGHSCLGTIAKALVREILKDSTDAPLAANAVVLSEKIYLKLQRRFRAFFSVC
jgi:hypothetical protein